MLIISGPSTIGKNPLIYKICELYGYEYIIPYTTRLIRKEEQQGKDYFFIAKEEFQEKIKNNEMIEWDYALNNYYGFSFNVKEGKFITHSLSRMALRLKAQYPNEITTIFLMPENPDLILSNIEKIYTGEMLVLRKELMREEIGHAKLFDKIFACSGSVFNILENTDMKKLLNKY